MEWVDSVPCAALTGEARARSLGDPLLRQALRWCRADRAAAVLRHYRCQKLQFGSSNACLLKLLGFSDSSAVWGLLSNGEWTLTGKQPLCSQWTAGDDPLMHLQGCNTCLCRFLPVDEELHKDVEGVLEMVCEVVQYLQRRENPKYVLDESSLLTPILELWDGACCCWSGKPKPGLWTGMVIRTAKLFTPEARAQAATLAQVIFPAYNHDCTLFRSRDAAVHCLIAICRTCKGLMGVLSHRCTARLCARHKTSGWPSSRSS